MSLKDITQPRSSHQVVYHKGHPTSNAILLYHETKREVVQQCIANLMSQFHDHYEHVEVIADSYKGIFEDKLIALYPHDASKRLWCENWASWLRHTFIEHLKLIYPQISNVADKTFLAMIKDLKFEFDLDDISVDTRFLSELRKVTDHYDTRASNEEVEAVKILIEKINVVNVLNWQSYFHAMALQCGEGFLIPDPTNYCRGEKSPHSGGKLWVHCFLLLQDTFFRLQTSLQGEE